MEHVLVLEHPGVHVTWGCWGDLTYLGVVHVSK
jgi:hypothetical protein